MRHSIRPPSPFARAGFAWEPRRSGELQLGLWRMRWAARGGNNRRLVFIPGLGDSPISWLAVLTLIAPTLHKEFNELVLVDFPGFCGFLAKKRAFHSLELMKGALFDTLDSLKPEALMGHSLGGYLSALYAIECAQGVRPRAPHFSGLSIADRLEPRGPAKLILVAPTGVFSCAEDRRTLRDKYQQAFAEKKDGFRHIRPHLFATEPFWFRLVANRLSEFFTKDDISQFISSLTDEHELTDKAHLIRSEVHIFWGENDALLPLRTMDAWLERLPKAHGILIKGAGHSPQIEAPRRVASELTQLLRTTRSKQDSPRLKYFFSK
ncbi:MAG: alpha/beta hydrolase [Oligoflexia bacterium]|nr:alpha/beta hydrolase [Oligoflexia bacterium]